MVKLGGIAILVTFAILASIGTTSFALFVVYAIGMIAGASVYRFGQLLNR